MEFKIDTKQSYTQITPIINHLSVNLADELCQKCIELAETDSLNFIIDLHNCLEIDNKSLPAFVVLHEFCYNKEHSLVFTNMQDGVMKMLKEEEIDDKINITPTLIEAIDIVSMEILERDLFKED